VPVNPNDHLRPHVDEWAADFTDLGTLRRLAGLPIELDVSPTQSPALSSTGEQSQQWRLLAQGHG
jgi:hypothetical protein